jgi:hypothetical protein
VHDNNKVLKPYRHLRYRWWAPADLKNLNDNLKHIYKTKKKEMPRGELEINLYKDERDEVIIIAHTLQAFLGRYRAVLNQPEAKPFTKKDQMLRKKVFEIYEHDRPTPLPWFWAIEPKFETEE